MALTRQQEKAMFAGKNKPSGLSSKDLRINQPITTQIKLSPIKSGQKITISYDEAVNRFENFLDKTKLEAFTFDPQINKGFDFNNKNNAKEFHNNFVVPKGSNNPVYAISLTNQLNITNTRELQSNFELVKDRGFRPMFGFFLGDKGDRFIDITEIVSGISKNEAVVLGKKYNQESISAIFKNGEFEIIRIE